MQEYNQMWFGTRDYAMWIPCPDTEADLSQVGWSGSQQYISGGVGVRNSWAAHKTFQFSWNMNTRDRLRAISDFANGVYGTGPFYFIDPMAADKNVLPAHWAFPGQAALDAPILRGDSRPNPVTTASNTMGYPTTSVTYDLTTGASQTLYIPIPPDSVAWVGAHGSSDGDGGLRVRPHISGITYAADEYPTLLGLDTTTRVNTSYPGSAYRGIELAIEGDTATTTTLTGLIVQILPVGVTPEVGGFISGQGHSGCTFSGKPTLVAYSSAIGGGMVGMTAVLEETEAWA